MGLWAGFRAEGAEGERVGWGCGPVLGQEGQREREVGGVAGFRAEGVEGERGGWGCGLVLGQEGQRGRGRERWVRLLVLGLKGQKEREVGGVVGRF